jgi:2,4-dienoyl-CoA reductase-like NADH-dependent reductase (Old Yellow Enzyme family)/thioredoxin reductase
MPSLTRHLEQEKNIMIQPQTPWELSGKKIKNRFILAPIKTAINELGGKTNEQTVSFYKRIAQGGAGLLILEPAAVSHTGIEHPKQLRLFEKKHVSEIQPLVDVIHENDARSVVHINHGGRAANPKVIGQKPFAPSAMHCPTTGVEAMALTDDQIKKIIDDFGEAATYAAQTNTDYIELQMGHGYLVHQFMSPRTNRRTDRWGDNKLFVLEVLDRVVQSANKIPLIARISGNEFVEGGLGPNNQGWLYDLLAERGIAAIHIGFGNSCDNPAWYFGHMALPEQPQIDAFKAIRKQTGLQLIGAGRLGIPERLNYVFKNDLLDAVGLARPLLADPDFPNKWSNGKIEQILQCGACLQGCLAHVKSAEPIACMANPWTTTTLLQKAKYSKKVMIVGSGPAGIAAAVTASERGHSVVLFEQHDYLGGQFAFAVKPPGKTSMVRVLQGMLHQLDQSQVKVRRNQRVTVNTIQQEKPDVLIVATGAQQSIPTIAGLETQYFITSYEFFEGTKPVEGNRVLVIGAGMVGIEVAEMVAAMGKEVVACRRSKEIGADMDPISRKLTIKRIQADGRIKLMPDTQLKAFTSKGVEALVDEEKVNMEPFDTVIICSGTESDSTLAYQAKGSIQDIRVIGDAFKPVNIEMAFAQGITAGREI